MAKSLQKRYKNRVKSRKVTMALTVMVLRAAALFLLLATGSHAFLATPLNASDPDVINILCPEQTNGVTRDHKWITREAIRRNIRRFFLDYPPLTQPNFNVPTDASLTELYRAYYGASSSPVRFIKAVNSVAASNVKADSVRQLRYDPTLQVDAERLEDTEESIGSRYPLILTSILQDEAYSAARSLLGLSLHTLQNFYSHSTWIEQGNEGILADLGFPGFAFNSTAGPEEAVCTPCSDAQGPCTGNVVIGAGLTTGYYQYVDEAANGFLVPKPTSGGKCSHGGVLDDSSSAPAEGGINKDTASPCFSPHFHLHEKAAELAVQATDHYLKAILDAVGNEKYRRLFDLYEGSALSIVIDTTQSMGNDIAAVQDQVAQIVNASSPELYILAPYNDPRVGPLTKTDDPEVFLDAVNALHAEYGGDAPELFWHGLQLALSNTPDYGNVFCFTDAGGKDGAIMESMIALAQSRAMKVNIVYSGKITSSTARLVTGIPEYQELADATGGLFIPSNKFDVDFITPILGDSVESSDVDITVLKDLTGVQVIDVPIDDSILDFTIHLAGYVDKAVLRDITGTEYNLTDATELESTPGVEVVAFAEALRDIRWIRRRSSEPDRCSGPNLTGYRGGSHQPSLNRPKGCLRHAARLNPHHLHGSPITLSRNFLFLKETSTFPRCVTYSHDIDNVPTILAIHMYLPMLLQVTILPRYSPGSHQVQDFPTLSWRSCAHKSWISLKEVLASATTGAPPPIRSELSSPYIR
ncbi:von Willebrand factor A domain-containing protein 7-like [Penaeus indicus]|uniref:von Willebrand factor A domain-containing protein 7-like n=1 Tax=Penaeus indicus TaxID=29960 RepID=UPI00300DAC89